LLKENDGALVEGIAEEDRSSKKKVREDRDVLECWNFVGRKISLKKCFGTRRCRYAFSTWKERDFRA
jgi:hypothetical protein